MNAAGWGLSRPTPVERSPYWVLADDGVTPMQVDQETRYAWVAAHPASAPPVRVGDDEFPGGRLSTVFIGLDALALASGTSPRLWETVVFRDEDEGLLGTLTWRSASRGDAVQTHRTLLMALRDGTFMAALQAAERSIGAEERGHGGD